MSFVFKKLLSVVSDLDTFHRDLGLGMGGAPRFFGSAVLRPFLIFRFLRGHTKSHKVTLCVLFFGKSVTLCDFV